MKNFFRIDVSPLNIGPPFPRLAKPCAKTFFFSDVRGKIDNNLCLFFKTLNSLNKMTEQNEQKPTIEQLYSDYRLCAEGERHTFEVLLEAHPDYETFHPHDEELKQIPDAVVWEYFMSFTTTNSSRPDHVKHCSFYDVKRALLGAVIGLRVLDLDLRAVIEDGWKGHALCDSSPRGGICSDIDVALESRQDEELFRESDVDEGELFDKSDLSAWQTAMEISDGKTLVSAEYWERGYMKHLCRQKWAEEKLRRRETA